MSSIKINADTIGKPVFHKVFKEWYLLTAAINPRTGEQLQEFGNDWNIRGQTKQDAINAGIKFFEQTK